MQNITFLRTMFDIFFDNAVVRTIRSLVNFCNEQRGFGMQKLKFSKKMPIKKVESRTPQFGQIVTRMTK